jgi:glutamyl-tRNA reductase
VLVARDGEEIPAHLFAVSSGLESLVVGEAEIAGQVSRALESARTAGSTTTALEQLFQRASRTSSSVQHRTRLGLAGRSIVRLALDLVEGRLPDWSEVRVLLIGTGTYAGAVLAALRDRGVQAVAVYSPSGRAERFARREGVVAVPRDDLGARLAAAHVVIACSIATEPILDAARLGRARERAGASGRQLVVDLGLPRNIDPDVVDVPRVELLDLETISLHAPLPELQASADARALIDQAVEEFRADQQAAAVTPAVVAFRGHVFELVEAELERLRRRGPLDESTERALRHLASVLVHGPSIRARGFAAQGEAQRFTDALAVVFGLEPAALAQARDDLRAAPDELAG